MMIHASYEDQYDILLDYVNELKRKNPNTTVEIVTFKDIGVCDR